METTHSLSGTQRDTMTHRFKEAAMLFKRSKRKYRIMYCTGKTLIDGEIYVVYAESKEEFEALLEEIKRCKYKVLDKTI